MSLEELKNYLRIRCLKVNERKNELVARVFAASKNGVKPIKTSVEVEADLKTKYLSKLKIDDRNLPDPFKIPQGCFPSNVGLLYNVVPGTFLCNPGTNYTMLTP